MASSTLKVGPMFSWPTFPDFPERFYDAEKVKASKFPNRYFYDWTVFTPEGLGAAEHYWDEATAQLASLLPERFRSDPARSLGINLGTFNGAFQKAWMRRGYSMYGIELADTAKDLHAYGCDGHSDNIYDLSTIASNSYDFGVLDRVLCLKSSYEERVRKKRETGNAPLVFGSIRRILKNDGAFIGVIYDWYDPEIVAELASMGGLTLWPHKNGRLAFCVDLNEPPTALPAPNEVDLNSGYFVAFTIGAATERVFLPTNEICRDKGGARTFEFAPPQRDAAKKGRVNRPVIAKRLGANPQGRARPRGTLQQLKSVVLRTLSGKRG